MQEPKETKPNGESKAAVENASRGRRRLLKKMGRFAAVTAPTVTLLLAARLKPAVAITSLVSSRQFKTGDGAVDSLAALAAVASGVEAGAIGTIDGVGLCLAAIKGLVARIEGLERQAAAL